MPQFSAATTVRRRSKRAVRELTKYSLGSGKRLRRMEAIRIQLPKKRSSRKYDRDANSMLRVYSFKCRHRNRLPSVSNKFDIILCSVGHSNADPFIFRWTGSGMGTQNGSTEVPHILWFVGTRQMDHVRRNVWRRFSHLPGRPIILPCVAHRSCANRWPFNGNHRQFDGHQRTHEHRGE